MCSTYAWLNSWHLSSWHNSKHPPGQTAGTEPAGAQLACNPKPWLSSWRPGSWLSHGALYCSPTLQQTASWQAWCGQTTSCCILHSCSTADRTGAAVEEEHTDSVSCCTILQ